MYLTYILITNNYIMMLIITAHTSIIGSLRTVFASRAGLARLLGSLTGLIVVGPGRTGVSVGVYRSLYTVIPGIRGVIS